MDDQLTLFGALPPYEETKQIAELLRVRIPDDSKKAFRRVMLVLHQQVNHIEKAIEDNKFKPDRDPALLRFYIKYEKLFSAHP